MGIELTVADNVIGDSGKSHARIDSKARKLLGVSGGEIIEIKGNVKSTAAIVQPMHPSDEGQGFIRIDGYIRQNAGVEIGDKIHASKVEVNDAKKLIIAPPPGQKHPISVDFADYAKRRLEGRPLTKGDSVPIPMFGLVLNFLVAQAEPQGIVRVTKETTLIVKEYTPSEMPTYLRYSEVIGYGPVKEELMTAIEISLRGHEKLRKLGVKPMHGILLVGPTGCGKTLLANAIAAQLNIPTIQIHVSDLISRFTGEAEERLQQKFKEAHHAAPCVVLIDSMDQLYQYNYLYRQLAKSMDSLPEGKVFVIAEANSEGILDALVKDGPFDKSIRVPLPDVQERAGMFAEYTKKMPLGKDVNLQELARLANGFTCTAIMKTCNEAGMNALALGHQEVIMADFQKAVDARKLSKSQTA